MGPLTIGNNKLDFYHSPHAAWQAMYDDCEQATSSIDFEQYIINDDKIGQRFLQLFARKARQGVAIRLMLDAVGSRTLAASPLLDKIRRHGGKILFFNQLRGRKLFCPSMWLPRNHAKTMIIDARIGYTGGVCIADHMGQWRDMHMRVMGALPRDMTHDFSAFWMSVTRRWQFYRRPPFKPRAALQYIAKHPMLKLNPVYREMLKAIRTATKRVYIVSPYFLPPFRLRRVLYAAARRGVDVQVLMSNVSDVHMVDKVARSYFPKMLRRGIKIFLYKPSVLHAKYTIIDDDWASVGSMNIDQLSITHNREANIMIRDAATIEQLVAQFRKDVADSAPATLGSWYRLPLFDRIIGRLGRAFRRVL